MSGELVVGVSGSPSDPSRTSTLVAATVARLAEEIDGARTETIEIGPLLADLAREFRAVRLSLHAALEKES